MENSPISENCTSTQPTDDTKYRLSRASKVSQFRMSDSDILLAIEDRVSYIKRATQHKITIYEFKSKILMQHASTVGAFYSSDMFGTDIILVCTLSSESKVWLALKHPDINLRDRTFLALRQDFKYIDITLDL